MPTYLYQVTAIKSYGKLAKGMNVEILIKDSGRKPNQKEVIAAINQKYGAGTALPGLSLTNFEIRKL